MWFLQNSGAVGAWDESPGRGFGKETRRKVKIDDMQFGFVPGKGTVDAIFMVRQLQEKFLEKRKDSFFAFVDLEKVFDRVLREVVRWALETTWCGRMANPNSDDNV